MKFLSTDIETTGINNKFCDMIEFGAILENTEDQKSYEDIPRFHRYLKPPRPEGYRGELYAINMHAQSGVWAEMNRIAELQKGMQSGKWQQKLAEETKTECIKRRGLPDLFEVAGIPRGLKDREDAQKLIHPRKLLGEFSKFLVDNGYENKEHNPNRPPTVDLGRVTVAGKNFFAFDWNYIEPWFGERICRRAIDPAIWYMNPAIDKAPPGTPECLRRAGLTATSTHTALGDAWDIILLTRKAVNSGALVKPDESI